MTHKLAIAEIIRTKLLGIHPDDQDVQLEDSDWRVILAALATPTALDPATIERMRALTNAIAEVPRDSALGQSGYASEARSIAALIRASVETQ